MVVLRDLFALVLRCDLLLPMGYPWVFFTSLLVVRFNGESLVNQRGQIKGLRVHPQGQLSLLQTQGRRAPAQHPTMERSHKQIIKHWC